MDIDIDTDKSFSSTQHNIDHPDSDIIKQEVVGAALVGSSTMEEVFENLILTRRDVRTFGWLLLDPDIDLEDYFD